MHTTPQLIELAKQRLADKHDIALPMSDYRLGKILGIKQPTISRWKTGDSRIGTEFAARFADACDLPGEYVYACIERERTEDPAVQSILERIAEHFSQHAAAFLGAAILAAGMIHASPANAASNVVSATDDLTIMRSRKRRKRTGAKRDPLTESWRRFLTVTPAAQPTPA